MKVNKRTIQKWCDELRSGKYSQTKNALNNSAGFCCLGVACKVFIPKNKQRISFGHIDGFLPDDQKNSPKWLKNISNDFQQLTGKDLYRLNDGDTAINLQNYSFNEIADLLEAVYIHEVL